MSLMNNKKGVIMGVANDVYTFVYSYAKLIL